MVSDQLAPNIVKKEVDGFQENSDSDEKILILKEEPNGDSFRYEVTPDEIECIQEKLDLSLIHSSTENQGPDIKIEIVEEELRDISKFIKREDCEQNVKASLSQEQQGSMFIPPTTLSKLKEKNFVDGPGLSLKDSDYSDCITGQVKIEYDDNVYEKEPIEEDGSLNSVVSAQNKDCGEILEQCCEASKKDFETSILMKQFGKYTEEKPYECKVQSESFSLNLSEIQAVQNQPKCKVCSKPFFNISGLMKKKLHKCEICSKYFLYRSVLERHSRTHTGEKPYECKICSKSFCNSSTLVVHLRVHTGDKPYKCKICSKCFSDGSAVNAHLRIHTGEKPYKCDLCSKSFSKSSSLARHSRIHTGKKFYECKICLKSFFDNSTLKRHSRIHTGEQPYSCKICSKSFSDISCLHKHSRTHTAQKPKCNVCLRSFFDNSTLNRHSKIHTR